MTQRDARSGWNAARIATTRSIRAYKPVGPVGQKRQIWDSKQDAQHMWLTDCQSPSTYDAISCEGCGYHECACTIICRKHNRTARPADVKIAKECGITLKCHSCVEEQRKLSESVERLAYQRLAKRERELEADAALQREQARANERALRDQAIHARQQQNFRSAPNAAQAGCESCGAPTRLNSYGRCERCYYNMRGYQSGPSIGEYDSMQQYAVQAQNHRQTLMQQHMNQHARLFAEQLAAQPPATPNQVKCSGVNGQCDLPMGHTGIHIVTSDAVPPGQLFVTSAAEANAMLEKSPVKLSELFKEWIAKGEPPQNLMESMSELCMQEMEKSGLI